MRRVFVVIVILILFSYTNGITFADPSLPLPRLPISGDQDGSETPLVLRAPGFDLLNDVQTFRVPGSDTVNISFDFIFREATLNNEFGYYPVDDISGRVNDKAPGEPGYIQAALGRAVIVFPSGSTAYTPDVTLQLNGGEIVAFFLIQGNTLANFLSNNPTNELSKRPLAFFSIDVLNPDNFDHFVGFRNLTDEFTQFGFEDLTGGGDKDYDDIVYNIKVVLRPSPSVERRDIVFIRGIDSKGTCEGFNQWVRDYFASVEGQSYFGNLFEVGKYLNFNYAGGGSYECPRPIPTPTPTPTPELTPQPIPGPTPIPPFDNAAYTAIDTCDGIAKAATELKDMINSEAAEKVSILAHSMGGLVTAYLVADDPNWAKTHIASVVTFDSPLKGVLEIEAWAKQFISACKLGSDPPSRSLLDLADTSSAVDLATSAATIVPFYPFDATKRDGLGVIVQVVERDSSRLDSARPFHLISLCGGPSGFLDPNCEPPLSVKDNHSEVWSRRFDDDNHDKAFLVGCGVSVLNDCAFLTVPLNDNTVTRTNTEIETNINRIRIASNFDSSVISSQLTTSQNSKVSMTLVAPDGTTYGPDGAGPIAAYAANSISEVYEIVNPQTGTWTIELSGEQIPAEGLEVGLALMVLETTDTGTKLPPIAEVGDSYSADLGEPITFNARGSFDPDGIVVSYEWDFDGDGVTDFSSTTPVVTHTYPSEYEGTVILRITDNDGLTDMDVASVTPRAKLYLPIIMK